MCCLKHEQETYEELNSHLPGLGDYVTTADGLWLGTLAGIPAPAADGLSAEATLTDTADLGSQVFFIKM